MKRLISSRTKNNISHSFDDIIEVRVFQNKNNKQFNLPVSKKHTSPQIIQDILSNKNVIGLKFKITDVIFRKRKGVGGRSPTIRLQRSGRQSRQDLKGGRA